MEKIINEGKDENLVLEEILYENKLSSKDIIYNTKTKKGKLFQGEIYEITAYKKQDINNFIKEYLKKIVENMGLEVTFEIINKEERVTIKMYSDKDPILIGKNGQTLKALETLAKEKLRKEIDIPYKFTLDVSDYKEKIERHLEYLAKKSAREVVRTKAPVILDNMTSYERRIIHNTLTDFKGVKTESEGEEPNRHVVIKPL